jgi:hypothetical protein
MPVDPLGPVAPVGPVLPIDPVAPVGPLDPKAANCPASVEYLIRLAIPLSDTTKNVELVADEIEVNKLIFGILIISL